MGSSTQAARPRPLHVSSVASWQLKAEEDEEEEEVVVGVVVGVVVVALVVVVGLPRLVAE